MTDDTTKPDPKRAAQLQMGQAEKPAPKVAPAPATESKKDETDVEEA